MRKTQEIIMQMMAGASSLAMLILCVGCSVVALWIIITIVRLVFQLIA